MLPQYSKTPSKKPTSYIPFLTHFSKYLVPTSSLHSSFLWNAGAQGALPGLKNGGTTAERRSRFAKDAEIVASWDFDRIVMCHGDVIEKGGKAAWLSAFGKVSLRRAMGEGETDWLNRLGRSCDKHFISSC